MSKKKLVVPEARHALEQFKAEIANEFGVDSSSHLASKHTGLIVRELIRMGQEELMEKNKGGL